eukprot:992775-Rhodomonas_salina.5
MHFACYFDLRPRYVGPVQAPSARTPGSAQATMSVPDIAPLVPQHPLRPMSGPRIAYSLKSNTRNRISGTNCTEIAVSCTVLRAVGGVGALPQLTPRPASADLLAVQAMQVSTGSPIVDT